MKKVVFWGLCALMALLPLPFGAVDEWAIFAFETATILLFGLYLVGDVKRKGQNKGVNFRSPKFKAFISHEKVEIKDEFAPGNATNDMTSEKLSPRMVPFLFTLLLAVFFGVTVLQIIPLPPFLLKVLSPGTYNIYSDIHRGILAGPEGSGIAWKTLSLAPPLSLYELIKYACYFLFAYLVFRCVRTRKEAEFFLLVMTAAALFQALYGMMEAFGGTERIFAYKKRWGLGSATGTFINRNHLAGFLEMVFPISLGYLLAKADFFALKKGVTFKEKILWFAQEKLQKTIVLGMIPAVIGLGIIFSRSRSGVFIFFITFFLMITILSAAGAGGGKIEGFSRQKRKRITKILRTLFLAVVFTAAMIGIKPVIERFSLEYLSRETRPVIFRNTVEIIKTYPLFGTGPGTYVYAYTKYEKAYVRGITAHAHNDYLELLSESGLVGGGCLILLAFGTLGYLFWRWMKRSDYFVRGVGLGCMAGIAAILLHSLTDFNLQIPANAVYFVTLFALTMKAVAK